MKRLEALLTKCKESIKANKQKTVALTEVKESLATQLASKEVECQGLGTQLSKIESELDVLRKKEQEEELQVNLKLSIEIDLNQIRIIFQLSFSIRIHCWNPNHCDKINLNVSDFN